MSKKIYNPRQQILSRRAGIYNLPFFAYAAKCLNPVHVADIVQHSALYFFDNSATMGAIGRLAPDLRINPHAWVTSGYFLSPLRFIDIIVPRIGVDSGRDLPVYHLRRVKLNGGGDLKGRDR